MKPTKKQRRRKYNKKRTTKIRRRKTYKSMKAGMIPVNSRNDILSVMTFNVELFLNLYNFAPNSQNRDKIQRFKTLFEGIDVACLQETYKSTAPNYPIFPNPLECDVPPHLPLQETVVCESHILQWLKSQSLYGPNSLLANSVYVSRELDVVGSEQDTISSVDVQRCFASAIVKVKDREIKITSVHLTGGRFDDVRAIETPEYTYQKLTQIKDVVEKNNPDIICGDFNTKIRTPIVMESTQAYFMSLLLSAGDIGETEMAERQTRWDTWIYMDNIHSYLTEQGYSSAYYTSDGSLIKNIQDTSAFGGIVDMIYYKASTLALVPNSVQIVGEGVVMERKPGTANMYTPILSDHYPVKADFRIV